MKHTRTITTRLIVILILCLPALAQMKALQGKVVAVADGDTITVLDPGNKQHRVRLLGIDAPERSQDFGDNAKQYLSDLVFGKQIAIEYDKADRYGRILGKVTLGDRDVNREMIRAGLAWHYKFYERDQPQQDRETYSFEEARARKLKVGLWSQPAPTPPWDFRRGESRQNSTAETKRTESRETVSTADRTEAVYVTRTGEKYHRGSCRHLSRSKIPISLAEAKRSYGACKVCRPPQ
jgi:endonuclease YncB( thermonuclease family)